MLVVRYFHIRPTDGSKKKFNGATVMVTGDTDLVAQVDVQVSFCSKKDAYCKSVGRDLAMRHPVKVVMLRYLCSELSRIEEEVYGYELEEPTDFTYALRYFLPKE
jgi:NADH:ubiquinone oxidoreductase subunit D